jgi:C4-dicarboxylate-specific signal transduction histidine kinase
MKRKWSLSLRVKSLVSVIGLVTLLSALNIMTFLLMRGHMNRLSKMIDITVVSNDLKALAGKETEGLPVSIELYSLHPTRENRAKILKQFDVIKSNLTKLDHADLDSSIKNQFKLVENMFQTYQETYDTLELKVSQRAPFSEVNDLVEKVKESSLLIAGYIQQLISSELNRDQSLKAELAKQVDREGLLLLLGIALSSILGVVIFYVFLMKENILLPLYSMQKTMGLIASDASDIRLRIQIKSEDEIGILGTYFNEMADTIQKYKEHLEELVETRTQQLTATQAMLVESGKLSALGEMAGGIAHEINNPLAVIYAKSSQLLDLLEDDPIDVPEIRKFIQSIYATTERITKIIRGLRSFSRNAANDPYDDVTVKTLVEDTIALCAEKFRMQKIDLRFTVGGDPNQLLQCRSTEISQVLLNFLNNAHDAIFSENERWIEIQTHDRGPSLEIWVTDSGKGIPEETAQKIFQPFFTTKEIGKGTGLGLSISKGIIEMHGGTLHIDRKCENTRFVILLPRVRNELSV